MATHRLATGPNAAVASVVICVASVPAIADGPTDNIAATSEAANRRARMVSLFIIGFCQISLAACSRSTVIVVCHV